MTDRKRYFGALTDSRRWDMINIRPDDVIVVTPPKSGTTWMQTIVALLFSGDPTCETELTIKMPWVDIRFRDITEVADRLEAMQHRRSMKSHTPLDGLPLHDEAQYLCVFRHPLDAHFSFRKHVQNIPMDFFDGLYPDDDAKGITFRNFLDADNGDCDAMPLAHIIEHYLAAKALSERPNVTLFHYAEMTRDLPGTFAKVAALLNISHSDDVTQKLVAAARFDNMKQHADRFAPAGGKGFFKSDAAFFDSGSSGKWQGQLTDAEWAAYDVAMAGALTDEDRAWLEYGSMSQDAT